MHTINEKLEAFENLLEIMDELREKCPWDKEQTMKSLRNLTIEETYELAEAISNNEKDEIKKELGDLLLHIVFYARIGSETGDFDIFDVIKSLNKKLINRHPHVFAGQKVKDAENVKENWEEIKMKEGNHSVLGGVPPGLPSMIKANRIQEKARAVGFDWENREQIWGKVREELEELEYALKNNDKDATENEFGDFFFSLINAARLYGVDPETALESTNRKFIKRFNYLEKQTLRKGKNLREMSLEDMNTIWEESKRDET